MANDCPLVLKKHVLYERFTGINCDPLIRKYLGYWIVLILLITLITGCANSNPNTSDESSSSKNIEAAAATSATSQALQSKGILETVTEQALDIKNDYKDLDEIGFAIMEEDSLGELKYGLKDKNIGIGNSKDEVMNAYNDLINQEESSIGQGFIVVGSVYGWILFTFDKSKVSEIFIGVSAD